MAFQQLAQLVIPLLDQIAGDKAPLGKHNGAAVRLPQGQRIAAQNVFAQDKFNGLAALVVGLAFGGGCILGVPNLKQFLAADFGVVLQNIYAVQAGNSDDGVFFVVRWAFAVLPFDHLQLAAKDLGQKSSLSAGWLQKAGVDALGLRLDQITHSLDFPLGGKHLTVIGYALFGFDLFRGHLRASFPKSEGTGIFCQKVYLLASEEGDGKRSLSNEVVHNSVLEIRMNPW